MIDRKQYKHLVNEGLRRSPVTALLGPRQCGKTTLAGMIGDERGAHYFDLESTVDRQRLENPELMFDALSGLVILDEIQLMPKLFSVLRVVVDKKASQLQFLILGSASPEIIKNVSETLAGRVEFVELSGFDLGEIKNSAWREHWVRGGFPRSFLADSDADSLAWREGFIRTFLERDIPQIGISIPPSSMRRFWTMLANYHGQIWNGSELGRAMGVSDKTVRSYLDLLTGTFMVRQLQPWYENIKKRQVKSPKIYLRDTGILHSLLQISGYHSLSGNPKIGASWEGYIIEQIMQGIRPPEAYFWATHSGAEIDLFLVYNNRRYGFEIKMTETPKITKSMRVAGADLALDHTLIIYPGIHLYPMDKGITAVPFSKVPQLAETLNSLH